MTDIDAETLGAAREGKRLAIETLLHAIHGDVYGLAVRMLWHPEDARDATQEILLKVVTRLATFRGDSRFTTWVFSIASNHLRDCRRGKLEVAGLDFDAFAADLEDGLDEHAADTTYDPQYQTLLDEIRVGCTLGMLSCLDRPHRLAYIIGEIFEMTDTEAARALQIAPATFRKRLSRARRAIRDFMQAKCGIVDARNRCHCPRRCARAVAMGRVNPRQPLFVSAEGAPMSYADIVSRVRSLELTRRAAALMRADGASVPDLNLDWLTNRAPDR